jgi:hypothetical protein
MKIRFVFMNESAGEGSGFRKEAVAGANPPCGRVARTMAPPLVV